MSKLETKPIVLPTYKRFWDVCPKTGTALSRQRSSYPLSFLPWGAFKRTPDVDEEKMYDYFVDDVHIAWAIQEGQDFIRDYLVPAKLNVAGKTVLDISGGNGFVLKQIEKLGATVSLTEINRKTIEFARATHGIDVFEYNLNTNDLAQVTGKYYDVILVRACLMFAHDLEKLVDQLRRSLNSGGAVMINHSVKPTVGVMTRVQLDEFSYYVLRQPETVIDAFEANGFKTEHRADEVDDSLYVYDHDLTRSWMFLHYLYELKCIRRLKGIDKFELRARDRRRSTMVFRLKG